jgi:hypothetical protein
MNAMNCVINKMYDAMQSDRSWDSPISLGIRPNFAVFDNILCCTSSNDCIYRLTVVVSMIVYKQ